MGEGLRDIRTPPLYKPVPVGKGVGEAVDKATAAVARRALDGAEGNNAAASGVHSHGARDCVGKHFQGAQVRRAQHGPEDVRHHLARQVAVWRHPAGEEGRRGRHKLIQLLQNGPEGRRHVGALRVVCLAKRHRVALGRKVQGGDAVGCHLAANPVCCVVVYGGRERRQ